MSESAMDAPARQKVDLPIYPSPEAVVADLDPSYPIFCVRPHKIHSVVRRFVEGFPGDVLYAVKCNPEPHMLDALFAAGVHHFDTASLVEVARVSEQLPGATSYFMHPVKSRAAILSAHRVYGVDHFVVDHPAELEKIAQIVPPGPDTVIVVRLEIHYEGAVYELSSKFGAPLPEAAALARDALARGYRYGLSFHVGSQCLQAEGFEMGLDLVGQVIAQVGESPVCVDVGGGFPGRYLNSQGAELDDYFVAIRRGLATLALPEECRVLCEPGRGLCVDGESLITQVHLRKDDALYLNDGMYGSFIEEKLGLQLPVRMIGSRPFASQTKEYTLYGPTCDSLDIFPRPISLPVDVAEGDWIEFDRIGAYGTACRTQFNGFYADTFIKVESDFGD
ncbi:MAG: type III PLP-dependent enzyme [Acidiferrobacteraceae bacterium]|nr:type III PLP-dependent enzyme [Acidiferrobacteraceae bacterium]